MVILVALRLEVQQILSGFGIGVPELSCTASPPHGCIGWPELEGWRHLLDRARGEREDTHGRTAGPVS